MKFKNTTYDRLKWIAQYLLPATGTLYFALSGIWSLPYGEQIVGTLSALTIFLSVILGISSAQFKKSDESYDGSLIVNYSDPNKDVYKLDLNVPLVALTDKKAVSFKVKDETTDMKL